MRFFRNLSLVLLASATVVSCGSYDDTDLWNEVNGIKDRVADLERRLEEACAEHDELLDALDRSSQRGVRGGIFPRGAKG